MNIVIIVNIIVSLTILLGGLIMKQYANNPIDRSIGFRTKKALSNDETWKVANKKCGGAWIIIGTVCFVLTLESIFLLSEHSFVQPTILILLVVSVILSAIWIEKQL